MRRHVGHVRRPAAVELLAEQRDGVAERVELLADEGGRLELLVADLGNLVEAVPKLGKSRDAALDGGFDGHEATKLSPTRRRFKGEGGYRRKLAILKVLLPLPVSRERVGVRV